MVNPSSYRTRNAVRRGALGLALALPLLTTIPARAQAEADSDQSSEEQIQLEDALTGENTDPQSAPQAVEVESFEGLEEAPVAVEDQSPAQPRVLITEVIIDGIDGHPEQERVELAAYDAMTVRPGSRVTRDELKVDLEAIYATGWFSDVRIEPVNGPLGVQLVVQVVPNPVLTKVELLPEDNVVPPQVIEDAFSSDYGRTLNLSELQLRMKELQTWYTSEGYALARVTGPTRVSPDGVVQLKVVVGTVAGVEVQFLNKEGETTNEKGEPIRGKTKPWVVTREISIKPGEAFNRN